VGEKEQLALRTADAVKAGNDQGNVAQARLLARVASMSSS
jgi:hypothetical protein